MDASRRRSLLPILTVLAALLIAACTTTPAVAPSFGSPVPSPSPAPSAAASPSAAPSPSPAAITFPLTLTDAEGTAVTIKAEPQKIVSLQPSTTEILYAIGAGDRVVGKVEDITPYPPEADSVPIVATYKGADIEKIVGLGADFVVAGGNNGNKPEDIAKLREVGIPVLVVYPESTKEVLADIELIGDAVGQSAEADALTADMQADLDAISGATATLQKPRTFYEIDATTGIYGPADDSFLAEMVELAGGTPITTGAAAFTPIPLEALIKADPEIIVLGDAAYSGATAATVAARPGWNVMTAVKNGAVRPANDVLITRPGPRLAAGLADLAKAIHPDVTLPAT